MQQCLPVWKKSNLASLKQCKNFSWVKAEEMICVSLLLPFSHFFSHLHILSFEVFCPSHNRLCVVRRLSPWQKVPRPFCGCMCMSVWKSECSLLFYKVCLIMDTLEELIKKCRKVRKINEETACFFFKKGEN